jgi:ribose transport system ATP-binding protein
LRAADTTLALRAVGLSKTYVNVKALDSVDFEVRRGEIHALIGGNGSGKSTLIKIIAGVESADAGLISIGGREFAHHDYGASAAQRAGVRVVHQDLGVFPGMSVAENIALGHGFSTTPYRRIRWREQRAQAQELLQRFAIDTHPRASLGRLSKAVQTEIAIARALQGLTGSEQGLLILDEPTASLPEHESSRLLGRVRGLASRGEAVVYISHRLDEVLAVADRVTVLRDGVMIGTYAVNEVDENRLTELIVGRHVEALAPEKSRATSKALLKMVGVTAGPLHDIDLEIGMGEVVGVAGLLGSGRSELLRTIFGDLKRTAGSMEMDGRTFSPRHPANAMAAGIALVPEDRATSAAFMDQSIATNLASTRVRKYWRVFMRDRAMRKSARKLMSKFFIKAGKETDPLRTLSGGNQQKVILARWLQDEPKLLLLDEPTQGVDVGARSEIYAMIGAAVDAGMSVLVVASDPTELIQVCSRVVVLRNGRIAGQILPPNITLDNVVRLTYEISDGETVQ